MRRRESAENFSVFDRGNQTAESIQGDSFPFIITQSHLNYICIFEIFYEFYVHLGE